MAGNIEDVDDTFPNSLTLEYLPYCHGLHKLCGTAVHPLHSFLEFDRIV